MTTSKVITGYVRYPESELAGMAQVACDGLTGNANFVFEEGLLVRFQEHITDYTSLKAKVKNGTTADVLKKNEAKKIVLDDMHYISTEVNQQAKGDLVKLQSSGFPLAKTASPVGPLPKPTDFRVMSGRNSGELLFEVDVHERCQVYLFFFAAMPASENVSEMNKIVSTTHKRNAGSFKPGTQYKCLCAYQGSSTELVYSDPVYVFVQ